MMAKTSSLIGATAIGACGIIAMLGQPPLEFVQHLQQDRTLWENAPGSFARSLGRAESVSGGTGKASSASQPVLRVLASDRGKAEAALSGALAHQREVWEAETTARNLRLIREVREKRRNDVSWLRAIEQELRTAAIPGSKRIPP